MRDEAATGVSVALERLVARFARLMRHVAIRHGVTDAEVSEVVQELRIRVWHALGTGEQIDGLGASYVYRAATTAAIDVVRRRRSNRSLGPGGLDADPEKIARSPTRTGPEQELAHAELAQLVSAAIGSLGPGRAVAVRLHLLGYGRGEIAELMGWSEARTRNLLYRGMDDLRTALRSAGITPESAP
jgi:RNA polymerase sigma factor (sigma-70 family)